MMKKRRKNPHAVAPGRLGGLVRSEAKRRANQENGRKGGLVKSRKKRIAARRWRYWFSEMLVRLWRELHPNAPMQLQLSFRKADKTES
jgi:hypothetical protein